MYYDEINLKGANDLCSLLHGFLNYYLSDDIHALISLVMDARVISRNIGCNNLVKLK